MRSHISTVLAASTLAASIPGATLADVSALDVWGSWKAYMSDFGYSVDVGSQTGSGGTLTLNDVNLRYNVEGVDTSFSLDKLSFEELGDGTVAITLPADMPFSMTGTGPDSGNVDVTAIIRQTDLKLIASGDRDNVSYAYQAQAIGLNFDKFIVDGEAIEPAMEVNINGLDGVTGIGQGGNWTLDSRSTMDSISMKMAFDDPSNGNTVHMDMTMDDLSAESTARMPNDIDTSDPSWLFSGAASSIGQMSSGPVQMHMDATGEESFTVDATSQAWDVNFDLSEGHIAYGGSSRNSTMSFASPDMPMPPINISLGQSAFDFAMPLQKTDDPQDFRFLMSLIDLSAEEFLWQMIDPQGMLPHDPASLTIDTEGKIRVLENMFQNPTPAEGGEAAPDMPMEIHGLTINELSLAIAGARADGSGAFTFDNSDTTTFDGMPAPSGTAQFDFYGVNGLIDTLISMGLLPEEQAMGARMMLGLFARPAEGDDHLTSEIEVNSDGTVLANGQQLR